MKGFNHHEGCEFTVRPGGRLKSEGVKSEYFFNEFVIRCPQSVKTINEKLHHAGILGGYDLESDFPELHNCMLLCVTEKRTKAQIDQLANAMKVS